MKKRYCILVGAATLVASLSALAHDPSEHAANAEKPDCAAMHGMDTSKMDPSDPVMLAMMKRCADSKSGETSHGMHDHGHQGAAGK